MKWLVFGVLLGLAKLGAAGALPCLSGAKDNTCLEEQKKDKPHQISPEVVSETAPVEAECLAGSEWESNCHSCKCSDAGVALCSRQKSCNQPVADPIRCKPNTTIIRDCNTCVCLENGLGLCTLKNCRKSPSAPPKKSVLVAGKDCAPGSAWTSRCNRCACSTDGYAICDYKECPGMETMQALHCAPNTMWKDDCNTCWCSAEGLALCTRVGCISDLVPEIPSDDIAPKDKSASSGLNITLQRKKRDNSKETPKACQPGQEFRMDCNKCLCDNEGQEFSCTRNDCNALNNHFSGANVGARTKRDTSELVSMECAAGSVFDKECNVCRCTSDGAHATCTMKRCTAETDDENETNASVPNADPNFRCNPGEQFKRGCNDCSCSADGKSVFCTVRFCDQDLSPSTI